MTNIQYSNLNQASFKGPSIKIPSVSEDFTHEQQYPNLDKALYWALDIHYYFFLMGAFSATSFPL